MGWEKIKALNRLGAGIIFDHMGGSYDYRYTFLKTLLERYPKSSHAPAAKFYMIQPGQNNIKAVEWELRELNAYIKNIPTSKRRTLPA